MKSNRKSFWLWAAVCAGIVLLGIWAVLRPEKVTRLADGRKVRVAAFTYGTRHQYWHGGLAARWLGPWLSGSWKRRLGWTRISHTASQPCLMVWLSWEAPRGNSAPAQYLALTDGKNETEPAHYKASGFPKRGNAVTGFEVTDFPRRVDKLGLIIYERDNAFRAHKQAELWAPNPMRDRSGGIAARAFPQATRMNGMNVIFENLVHRGGESMALFRVEGDDLNQWAVQSFELRDDSGNRMQPAAISCVRVGEYLQVAFQKAWWENQKSYDWTLELARTSGFQSNEVFVVAITNLPPEGSQSTYGGTVHRAESTVVLAEINRNLPRGSPAYKQPVWNTEVILQVIPPTPGLEVLLLTASAGTNSGIRSAAGYVLPNGRRTYLLELPPVAEHLNVTFAMQATVKAGFSRVPPPRGE